MTAKIESNLPVKLVSGTDDIEIIAPKFPWMTTDDVVYSKNYGIILTDLIENKQTKIGNGNLTVNHMDVNLLTNMYNYGLTNNDLRKLADITVPAVSINMVSGARLNLQYQIDQKITGPGINLTGLNASAEQIDGAVNMTDRLAGLISTVTELNTLHSTNVKNTDFVKLVDIDASAHDVNVLIGVSQAGLTSAEIIHLVGARENIQAQLDRKAELGHKHVIGDITDINVGATEINFLEGITSNVQNQLNIITRALTPFRGGDLSAQVREINGSPTTPSYSWTTSPGTGFYRPSPDQIGISIAGNHTVLITGTSFQFGSLTGNPILSNATPSVTAPAFTFVGDTTTGLYRIGPGSMAVANGGRNMQVWDSAANKVTLGSKLANTEVDVAGVFNGTKLLAKPVLNMKSAGLTPLYKVPTGRNCVVERIVCVVENFSRGTGNVLPDVNLGFTAPLYEEFVSAVMFPGLFDQITHTGQIGVLGQGMAEWGYIGTGYRRLLAGEELTARIMNPTDYATLNVRFLVYGTEY